MLFRLYYLLLGGSSDDTQAHNIFMIDVNLEFKYKPIERSLYSKEKEAIGPVSESFEEQFDSFLKEHGTSIDKLGVQFFNTSSNLTTAKLNMPTNEFNGIRRGNIDGVIVLTPLNNNQIEQQELTQKL